MPRKLTGPRHSRRGGADREHMRIRHELLRLILEIAQRDSLTDYDIANACRTSRPRASNLLHAHIARFNSETLIDILWRLGVTVDVTVVSRRPYHRWNIDSPRPGWRPIPGFAHG
jgi:predicted XRE-type DNA-binding protein